MDYDQWPTEELKEKYLEYKHSVEFWSNAEKEVRDELIRRNYAAIKTALDAKEEPYGTVSVNGMKFYQPKSVTWDQEKLGLIVADIAASGEDPEQYVKISYKVPEGNYKSWPDAYKQAFIDARTVKGGQMSVEV